MKVKLVFVYRNDDHSIYDVHDNDDDDDDDHDGPLQLIRPMPNEIRDYVSTKDYEHFCIHTIDPLLEALYEAEKSVQRCATYIMIIWIALFFIGALSLMSYNTTNYLYIWCILLVLMLIRVCVQCNSPAKQIQEEIRTECDNMSNHCSTHSHNKNICFKLVMKRVMRSADENGIHYNWKISHIVVTVLDKKDSDDDDTDVYTQLPCF